MALARQIKVGLYCITWHVEHQSAISREPVRVENLPEIFESCHLAYKVVENEDKIVLEMQPVFSEIVTPSSKLNATPQWNSTADELDAIKDSKWVTSYYSYNGYYEDNGCSASIHASMQWKY